jgi:hypothetical protein
MQTQTLHLFYRVTLSYRSMALAAALWNIYSFLCVLTIYLSSEANAAEIQ